MKIYSILLVLSLGIAPTIVSAQKADPENVSVTFHNGSARSIPLKIENVMNPNLSPFSDSGVTMAEGTRIYYRDGRKWVEILVITSDYNGKTIEVDEILKEKNLR
jgi:hypothetical protein